MQAARSGDCTGRLPPTLGYIEDATVFNIGERYRRRDEIHGVYGGQAQGGISTPTKVPCIFLFTSDAGEAYGYSDSFRPDGSFWYTGEGQVGHMEMARGNRAIVEHSENEKRLLLFEYVASGLVRFLGEVEYLGHHVEERPDRNGDPRNALIFHLGFRPLSTARAAEEPKGSYSTGSSLPKKLSLAELRWLALEGVPPNSSTEERRINVTRRSEAIRRYALARATGVCEGCRSAAPFATTDGPYLEVHHVFRLSDGGPDHPAAVIALCPTCHRRAHYAVDATAFNSKLIEWLEHREGRLT